MDSGRVSVGLGDWNYEVRCRVIEYVLGSIGWSFFKKVG